MHKPNSYTAAHTLAHCSYGFWNCLVVCGMPIEMYGESYVVHARPSGYHYHAAYIYGGYRTSRISGWCLNHIHSMKHAEVINTSLSNSSAEIDYIVNRIDTPYSACLY